ncbi:MAG: GSCFA domain-containing protein [Cyclobacteriaceae bacterium]
MFKLNLDIPPSSSRISLEDKIYLTGSCFSDEIGARLSTSKFDNIHNPFGTLYNPLSIFKTLRGDLDPSNTIENQGVFYHWDYHGKISSLSDEDLEKKVVSSLSASNNFLANSKYLIVTLGTSFVYELNETSQVVANCHKVPASKFRRRLLDKDEIVQSFGSLHEKLNPNLTIVFTVSPVRHAKDGLVENNLSKAILLQAVHQTVNDYENVEYFPAFEIMNDELRDYRFFAEDMVHPSQQAVDYIWQKFSDVYFDDNLKAFIQDWAKIRHAINHKPFQPKSAQHIDFVKRTISKLHQLGDRVDVSHELETLQSQLQ